MRTLLLTGLLLTACSSGDTSVEGHTDAGYAALGSGSYVKASKAFEAALESMEPGHPLYERAEAGWVDALIEVNPAKATEHLVQRLGEGAMSPAEVATYGRKLLNAEKHEDAGKLVGEGLRRFEDDVLLADLQDTIVETIESAGNNEALEVLKGLGYVDP